jgi:murein DD-endopeptidase MepM/ murein hydrolase activator NlpD
MDVARRRVAGAKRTKQQKMTPKRGEKRRLIQLVISLSLFLIVFLGQDVFSAKIEVWGDMISNDANFSSVFTDDEGESLVSAFRKLKTILGNHEENDIPEASASPAVKVLPEIVMLSQTDRCGFTYIRENSFLNTLPVEPVDRENIAELEPSSEPAVVTAVAQAFSPSGEALPTNVSFQYYELGLEETVSPVMGAVTSEFGYRIGPISGKKEFHLAIDIAAEKGTEIKAFADGVVRYIGENPDTFGLYVMIDHNNGVATFYAHCSKLLVRKGETVSCGQTIALVGETGSATGPHLHFTLSKDSVRLDPAFYVDPS